MNMLIGGAHRDASDKAFANDLNPVTGEVVDTFPLATPQDVQEALENSRKGFLEWSSMPLHHRLGIVCRYADLALANVEKLAQLMSRESGKVITLSRAEATVSAEIFRWYAEKARNLMGEALPLDPEPRTTGDLLFTIREPLGVVACIVPFNYPAELYAHKVAPALVAGNAVIVKPSSDTPLVNVFQTELLLEAGVPGNAAQIVTGSGSKVGAQIVQSPLINKVSLTGSTEVGIQTFRNSAESLHKVGLELGGNDPLVIFEDCDLELALSEVVVGRCFNAGQTCCASKRFIVQRPFLDRFVQKLLEKLQTVRVGDPFDERNTYGSLINESAAREVERQVAHTVAQGARCLCGGKRRDRTFFDPTVLVDVTPQMDIARDMEVFGPVIPVIAFDTVDEAIAIANNIPYGLQGGVMTTNMKTAFRVARAMQCGCCVVNGCSNYRSAHQAFGGWKMSGQGREGIGYTLEEMSQVKTIALRGIFA